MDDQKKNADTTKQGKDTTSVSGKIDSKSTDKNDMHKN